MGVMLGFVLLTSLSSRRLLICSFIFGDPSQAMSMSRSSTVRIPKMLFLRGPRERIKRFSLCMKLMMAIGEDRYPPMGHPSFCVNRALPIWKNALSRSSMAIRMRSLKEKMVYSSLLLE